MYEVDSEELVYRKIVEEFNKKSNKYTAKLGGVFISLVYTKTIKIKEKKFLGKSIHIECWDTDDFNIHLYASVKLDGYKEMIGEFEDIIKKEVKVTRIPDEK